MVSTELLHVLGNKNIHLTPFITRFVLLQRSGTESTIFSRYACTIDEMPHSFKCTFSQSGKMKEFVLVKRIADNNMEKGRVSKQRGSPLRSPAIWIQGATKFLGSPLMQTFVSKYYFMFTMSSISH